VPPVGGLNFKNNFISININYPLLACTNYRGGWVRKRWLGAVAVVGCGKRWLGAVAVVGCGRMFLVCSVLFCVVGNLF
jgi:hypothetical protein